MGNVHRCCEQESEHITKVEVKPSFQSKSLSKSNHYNKTNDSFCSPMHEGNTFGGKDGTPDELQRSSFVSQQTEDSRSRTATHDTPAWKPMNESTYALPRTTDSVQKLNDVLEETQEELVNIESKSKPLQIDVLDSFASNASLIEMEISETIKNPNGALHSSDQPSPDEAKNLLVTPENTLEDQGDLKEAGEDNGAEEQNLSNEEVKMESEIAAVKESTSPQPAFDTNTDSTQALSEEQRDPVQIETPVIDDVVQQN